MAVSRYEKTKNENFDYHNTFRNIDIESIKADDDFFYVIKDRERIDQLARRFLGDGRYWWVICLLNGFDNAFDAEIMPGITIRIPRNINNVLTKL